MRTVTSTAGFCKSHFFYESESESKIKVIVIDNSINSDHFIFGGLLVGPLLCSAIIPNPNLSKWDFNQ